ncbi:MAG: dipeptidase [Alphaproteobacteria bacterium]|nr:dipeptidase [Alphaproteobacteria bacterium]
MSPAAAPDAQALHRAMTIIDCACPLAARPEHLGLYVEGGFSTIAPTVGSTQSARDTMRALGAWLAAVRQRDDVVLVRTAADIATAKALGKLGLILHFQGTEPFEDSVDLVDAWAAMGIRMVQIAYNARSRAGDGCEEPNDAGLSRFGRDLVKRLADCRVVLDLSHTGYRTVMEAIDASPRTPVISHANAHALRQHPRNVRDDQIKAIARRGGLVGVVGYPAFVTGGQQPTLDQLIDHIAHIAAVGGIDHVGLGIDYFWAQEPLMPLAEAQATYRQFVAQGSWDTANYPPPPWRYPTGIETPASLVNLTRRLLERGFSAENTAKVMGGNWLRVFREVWGG